MFSTPGLTARGCLPYPVLLLATPRAAAGCIPCCVLTALPAPPSRSLPRSRHRVRVCGAGHRQLPHAPQAPLRRRQRARRGGAAPGQDRTRVGALHGGLCCPFDKPSRFCCELHLAPGTGAGRCTTCLLFPKEKVSAQQRHLTSCSFFFPQGVSSNTRYQVVFGLERLVDEVRHLLLSCSFLPVLFLLLLSCP